MLLSWCMQGMAPISVPTVTANKFMALKQRMIWSLLTSLVLRGITQDAVLFENDSLVHRILKVIYNEKNKQSVNIQNLSNTLYIMQGIQRFTEHEKESGGRIQFQCHFQAAHALHWTGSKKSAVQWTSTNWLDSRISSTCMENLSIHFKSSCWHKIFLARV